MRLYIVYIFIIGFFIASTPFHVQGADSVEAQIQALITQLNQLQTQQKTSAGVGSQCPVLTATLERGARDAATSGQVTALQQFLARQYNLNTSDIVTGFFGDTTKKYVEEFQRSQNISVEGIVGPRTRSAIAAVCAQAGKSSTTTEIKSDTKNTTGTTLNKEKPKGSIDAVSLPSLKSKPRITGTAKNTATVGVSIGNSGGKVYGSGPVSVVNGKWSIEISSPFMPDTYTVELYDGQNTRLDVKKYTIPVVVGPVVTLPTPLVSLSLSPTSIGGVGEAKSAVLTWSVSNAQRCVLQYGASEEVVSTVGTKTVSPTQTTVYRLWCANDNGKGKDGPSAEKTVTLTVKPIEVVQVPVQSPTPVPKPVPTPVPTPTTPTVPTLTVNVSPATLGGSTGVSNATLAWTSAQAKTCSLAYDTVKETVSLVGTKVVAPTKTTTYTINCTNDQQSVAKTATVTVTPVPAPTPTPTPTPTPAPVVPTTPATTVSKPPLPIITVSGSPLKLDPAVGISSSKIRWTATQAVSCLFNDAGKLETVPLSGSRVVTPTTSAVYSIQCKNTDASGTQSVTSARGVFVTIVPKSTYYTQYITTYGIPIKATGKVDPRALTRAKEIIDSMLVSTSPELRERLTDLGLQFAIIPKDEYITTLPEYFGSKGKSDPNGSPYDSFAVRGGGGTKSSPLVVSSEENLLKLPGDRFYREDITYHEFAHATNMGFSVAEEKKWAEIYANAKTKNTFPGAFGMVNAAEYWAELSQSYFGQNNEMGGREDIARVDPEAYAFVEAIYTGKAVVREENEYASQLANILIGLQALLDALRAR